MRQWLAHPEAGCVRGAGDDEERLAAGEVDGKGGEGFVNHLLINTCLIEPDGRRAAIGRTPCL